MATTVHIPPRRAMSWPADAGLSRGGQRARGSEAGSMTGARQPFAAGEGPAVRGRAVDLVLAMAGRPVALDHLQGPGLPVFTARVVEPSGRVREPR